MKVIDLLVKIANGEEMPKKIKYEDYIYIHVDNNCYYCDDTNLILSDRIFVEYNRLNDYIEIIEDKPEKIDKMIINEDLLLCNLENFEEVRRILDSNFREIANRFNELRDGLNYLLEKSDSNE